MHFLEDLQKRGLLKQVTNEDKLKQAQEIASGVYCGIDPTASSLHVGHILQIVLLYRFADAGFKPIAVLGQATAMIGDPSFKKQERKLLEQHTVIANNKAISKQLQSLLDNRVIVLNNHDWLSKISLLDYLRELGKDFSINYMLDKESISTRLVTGISYTEFSYMILQAYDFFHLYVNNKCYVQIGGSDQWGNITAGIDFIRKKVGDKHKACGLTIELLTQSNGEKFGKTEKGTLWLDANLTSPYALYQFFLNQSDEDVEKLLKWLTLLSLPEIEDIIKQHDNNRANRYAQKRLAEEIVKFIHSPEALDIAILISKALFSQNITKLNLEQIYQMRDVLPWLVIKKDTSILEVLLELDVVSSKTKVRELLNQHAISVNEQVITDENYMLTKSERLHERFIFIRKGKYNYCIVEYKDVKETNRKA